MSIRAVLFDFDGTLADTTELFLRTYRHTLERHLGAAPPDEEWRARFGMPLDVQLAHYAATPDEVARLVASFREYQREHEEPLTRPFPGVMEVVLELARRGLGLAIVTSKHRPGAIRAMGLCGLTDHFPVLVTPDDVARGKPHPDPVLLAVERLGVSPSEAIFLGDSPFDMAAGRAAGTVTAAALWGAFPRAALEAEHPDHLLERPEELLEVV
jgi:pyrophosphatase PpaX